MSEPPANLEVSGAKSAGGKAEQGALSGDESQTFSPWLSQASLLIVDDEPGMRNFLVRTLSPQCKCIAEAHDTVAASRLLDLNSFDLIILDNKLAGKSGLSWLQNIRNEGYFGEVILITAFADLETAIEAIRAGAADFVLKPFRTNQILNSIARCLDRTRLRRENFVLRRELKSQPIADRSGHMPLGTSSDMRQVREIIARVASLPTTVLISGESGTGKEVTARAIHNMSPRSKKPFVPLNCAAIAHDAIESELFGHIKGAFTGAVSSREGLFFYAQGGTLFLDEIAELPLSMQSKFLRIIEEKRLRPVGAEREIPVDVRIVAASNYDLQQAVTEGRFRQDLFFRLNVMHIHLSPLRKRREDLPSLVAMFMEQISAQLGVAPLTITPAVLAALGRYPWPGNARELRNVVERSLILGCFPSDIVESGYWDTADAHSVGAGGFEPPADSLAAVEKQHILATIASVGGNRAEAARRLGVSRKTLDRKCALWNV